MEDNILIKGNITFSVPDWFIWFLVIVLAITLINNSLKIYEWYMRKKLNKGTHRNLKKK